MSFKKTWNNPVNADKHDMDIGPVSTTATPTLGVGGHTQPLHSATTRCREGPERRLLPVCRLRTCCAAGRAEHANVRRGRVCTHAGVSALLSVTAALWPTPASATPESTGGSQTGTGTGRRLVAATSRGRCRRRPAAGDTLSDSRTRGRCSGGPAAAPARHTPWPCTSSVRGRRPAPGPRSAGRPARVR